MKRIEMQAAGLDRYLDGSVKRVKWTYAVERRDYYEEGDSKGDIYITSQEEGNGEFSHAATLDDGTEVYVEIRDSWGNLNRDGYVYYEMVDGSVWWEDEQLVGALVRPVNHPERIYWSDNKYNYLQGNGAELPAGKEDDVKWLYCDIDKKLNI